MSTRILLTDEWSFSKHALGTSLEAVCSGGTNWQPVDLPHDWLIWDTTNLYQDAEGWYRRSLVLEQAASAGQLALRFEGVYMDCTVFLNGRAVFEWKYGYSTFEFDIGAHARPGDNEILVRTVHQSPNSRWYSGAGIYRNVWLISRPPTHLAADGIYLNTRQCALAWQLEVRAEIAGPAEAGGLAIAHTVIDPQGRVAARSLAAFKGPAGPQPIVLELADPLLWDLASPHLYCLKTELIQNGQVIDSAIQRFGFRSISVHPNEGFRLNGRRIKLQGVCQHHDLGCLGAAMNKTALRRQLRILKSMGTNAIRTAHNMPAVELMDLADEMGFLIVSESFDMWERPKTTYDYARFFLDWAERDMAAWVRRDRNHPSLVMWCIGNEIYDIHAGERGLELARWLADLVLRHDPGQNALVTIGSNYMPWEGAQKCADFLKLVGYNYGAKYYDSHHRQHPDWIIYGSETGSVVQSRGIYHFPASQSMLADDDQQCSSLGNSATSWGAKSTEACIISDRDTEFSLGQFIWSGFDYIGEPTPYHTKNSYFGQIDTAGFPKDSFYIYQAAWTDYRSTPMVHLFPWWDFNEGQLIDVQVCSNAPLVELYRDGVSLGRQAIDHQHGSRLLASWQLPYNPGILEAVAYDASGTVIARDSQCSFGDASRMVLAPDKVSLLANGSDLIFLEISMQDSQGRVVANANNRVAVSVQGAGRLVGLDNGDSADFDQYKGTSRRLFSGKLLAVVAACTTPGTIKVEVCSPGLEPARLELAAEAAGLETSAAAMENFVTPCPPEIPVRRIEILSPSGTGFNPGLRSMTVQARLHPANATHREVEWRVTNDAGIDSNIAALSADGLSVRVDARGDGQFRLRCSTRNGGPTITLISQLEFSASGLGQAYLDPYGFISGGLYSRSLGDLGNGNERGVATPRDSESQVCFDNIDFGSWGSDEMAVPIFELDNGTFPIEVWDGMPADSGSSLLAIVIYQRPSIWNTYQTETWKLPRRLTGVRSICFVIKQHKIHLKGFSFTKPAKAFQTLGARDNDCMYGDSYRIMDDSIEGIGNNVSLEYREMDFGAVACRKLTICGRTRLDRNTIHVRFGTESAEITQLVEFLHAAEYQERSFDLEALTGMCTVTLVFLPGCDFDLRWLRFS